MCASSLHKSRSWSRGTSKDLGRSASSHELENTRRRCPRDTNRERDIRKVHGHCFLTLRVGAKRAPLGARCSPRNVPAKRHLHFRLTLLFVSGQIFYLTGLTLGTKVKSRSAHLDQAGAHGACGGSLISTVASQNHHQGRACCEHCQEGQDCGESDGEGGVC